MAQGGRTYRCLRRLPSPCPASGIKPNSVARIQALRPTAGTFSIRARCGSRRSTRVIVGRTRQRFGPLRWTEALTTVSVPGGSRECPPTDAEIAYARPRTADAYSGDVWLMSARTGRPIRRLWRGIAASIDWSPGGTHVVLTGYRRGYQQLADVYVVRANGTQLRRLTSTPKTAETDAVWSPDGRRLAIVQEFRRPDGDCCEFITESIWTMRPDGSARRHLRGPWRRHSEESSGPVRISWQPLPPH